MVAQGGRQHCPAFPVVFSHAVLDGNQGIAAGEFGQPFGHFGIGEGLVFTLEHIFAVLVEFAGGNVDGQGDFCAGIVAGLFDGLHHVAESLVMILEIRGRSRLHRQRW